MKQKIVILGKLPPPYMGPAIATKIILNSSLSEHFELIHLDTKLNETVATIGSASWSKLSRTFSLYSRYRKLIKKHKPELVLIPISQTTMGFIKDSFFILIASLSGRKVLLHLRGSNFLNWMNSANGMAKKYVRFVLSKSDGMIVLGEKLRYLFQDYYPDNQIYVVPNGANYSYSKPTDRSDKIQILYLANLLKSKGIEDVLEAIDLLKQNSEVQFEFHAAGSWRDPEFEKMCKGFCETNNLPVIFHEPISGKEKDEMFVNSDVFVFTPNEPEGHPWVLVEAMAAGLPVISTDQGAITESVIHDKNGFIVESHSPHEIAKRLGELIKSVELREQMKREALRHYQDNFTEEKMVANLKNTIQSVLNSTVASL
ncbi:MAG: glycosyltransferase family 4 protein [Flavobacteriales bacterium]|nr:glycosyltransferase family 4 protein [Flavobacteriales bacterium]